jgi:hypothetical protein
MGILQRVGVDQVTMIEGRSRSYKPQWRVERLFASIPNVRRLVTRYERRDANVAWFFTRHARSFFSVHL